MDDQPSTSSAGIVLLPVSLSTRSKKSKPPELSLKGCDDLPQREDPDFAVPSSSSSSSVEVIFERPLTRARKRHMARTAGLVASTESSSSVHEPKRRK